MSTAHMHICVILLIFSFLRGLTLQSHSQLNAWPLATPNPILPAFDESLSSIYFLVSSSGDNHVTGTGSDFLKSYSAIVSSFGLPNNHRCLLIFITQNVTQGDTLTSAPKNIVKQPPPIQLACHRDDSCTCRRPRSTSCSPESPYVFLLLLLLWFLSEKVVISKGLLAVLVPMVNLHICGTINAEKNIQGLEQRMLPSKQHLFQGHHCLFQQDNAKTHIARYNRMAL